MFFFNVFNLIISGGPGQPVIDITDPTGNKFTNLASIVSAALPLIYAIAGLLLFAYLVWGGFNYLTSMGDPKKAESGKGKITNAIIGFVIIFVAYWLVQIVDYIFRLGIYSPVTPR
jgi:hypothetical protein